MTTKKLTTSEIRDMIENYNGALSNMVSLDELKELLKQSLPKNTPQLADLIYSCIDLSEHREGSTLLEVIKEEKGVSKLTVSIIEDWLRGLPSACSIPYWDNEIEELLESSGNSNWSVDDYWHWSASRVMQFALHPKAYK